MPMRRTTSPASTPSCTHALKSQSDSLLRVAHVSNHCNQAADLNTKSIILNAQIHHHFECKNTRRLRRQPSSPHFRMLNTVSLNRHSGSARYCRSVIYGRIAMISETEIRFRPRGPCTCFAPRRPGRDLHRGSAGGAGAGAATHRGQKTRTNLCCM